MNSGLVRGGIVLFLLLTVGCGEFTRDNPFDPKSDRYDYGSLLIGRWDRTFTVGSPPDEREVYEVYTFQDSTFVHDRLQALTSGQVDTTGGLGVTSRLTYTGIYEISRNELTLTTQEGSTNMGIEVTLPPPRTVQFQIQGDSLLTLGTETYEKAREGAKGS